MNNRKLGNTFEQTLSEILHSHGFWVHLLNQNKAGQPADIIAVRNTKSFLIDAKVCSGKGFDLDRIEYNQELAMTAWAECGNGDGWFALLVDDGEVYMLSYPNLIRYREQCSTLPCAVIREIGAPLEEWVKRVKKW